MNIDKENSPIITKRSFPTIRNTVLLNKDNNHIKMNSLNYFNKTTGVLFNSNKKRNSIKIKDEVDHIPEIVKIKSKTSNSNVYNHRALIPLQNKKDDNIIVDGNVANIVVRKHHFDQFTRFQVITT